MKSNKPGYLVAVVLLGIVLSIPQGWSCFGLGHLVWNGFNPLPSIPGITTNQNISYSEFNWAELWHGNFVRMDPDNEKIKARKPPIGISHIVVDWKVSLIDPESGKTTETEWGMEGDGFQTLVCGDRLLFCGSTKQYEVIDGSLQPIDLPRVYESRFLLDGKIAIIQQIPGNPTIVVSVREPGSWGNDREVVLPSAAREFTIGTTKIKFEGSYTGDELTCVNQGDRIHTFLRVGGHLLYRHGLTLKPLEGDGESITYGSGSESEVARDDQHEGWTLIRPETVGFYSRKHQYGTVIEGVPGALIVDNAATSFEERQGYSSALDESIPDNEFNDESGYPIGHLYKFDGTNWTEIAKIPFPFGSNRFRAIVRGEVQSPYIVATTSTGTSFVYVVESDGIRQIKGQGPALTWSHVKEVAIYHLYLLAFPIGLGFLPILGIWFLMIWCTKPDYEFGASTVRLASLIRRGLARLIDLAVIALSTATMGWLLLHNLNWLALAEAHHLKLDHPAVHIAERALAIMFFWIAFVVIVMVIVQGCWGITPGKWLCGLRTLRTTTRPCGIARSLVREVILVVESGYLLYWLPCVMCIAFKTNRQRFGDIVADTIVVDWKSFCQLEKSRPAEARA